MWLTEPLEITMETATHAVYGGAVLGGGGGGSIEEGLKLARLAVELRPPRLINSDEMDPDSMVVTVAAVGSPAARDQMVRPLDYVEAVLKLQQMTGFVFEGIISNENGGMATVNGWLQSSVLRIPVVDCACNGRAHPTSVMGAMGLDAMEGYISHQVAIGGDPKIGRYVQVSVSASLREASRLVREAAISAGGLVAVARNPVSVGYAEEYGAPGAISMAISVGQALLTANSPQQGAERVANMLRGQVLAQAVISDVELRTEGGYDVGLVRLEGGWELTFWNEYMTLEKDGERLATFPDLIVTLAADELRPLGSAEVTKGREVILLTAPKDELILGEGMRRPELFEPAEKAIGKPLIPYAFAPKRSRRRTRRRSSES